MSDHSATPTAASARPCSILQASTPSNISTTHNHLPSQKSELYLAWDDWDFDFDGAIWPKSNEPVDPNLSLGVIIWHPAKQVTRALPATFGEAEEQSLKAMPEKLGNGESVSIYFTAENSHEAFLDVRQTDEWDHVKNDPAFVTFKDEEMRNYLVHIEECIAQRDRPDESSERIAITEDAEMHEADWSVMDNLEQALSASGEGPKPAGRTAQSRSAILQTQDDILASLGVTGMPKPVSGEPMPFTFPAVEVESTGPPSKVPDSSSQNLLVESLPSSQTKLTTSSTSSMLQIELPSCQLSGGIPVNNPHSLQQRPYGTTSSSVISPPPPPPPPPEQDRYDPWNPCDRHQQYHVNGFNGGRGSPVQSEASDGTAAGSDFGVEKPSEMYEISRTPGSQSHRDDSAASRKRSYGDTHTDDDRGRDHDDQTKRKRHSQVNGAYR